LIDIAGGVNAEIAYLGLLADDEIELDSAALALSALDHPGTDLESYLDQLRAITASLEAARRPIETADLGSGAAQGALLAEIIGGRFGFIGDAETYDAPINGDMIRVLDRRRGLPISLSILYVAAARRLGWTAHALNTPAHVLVGIGPSDDMAIIDPFHAGAPVSSGQLMALLERTLGPGARPDADNLSPMSNRLTLVRLLMNQATRAEQAGDISRACVIYGRITVVAPEHDAGWWELARLQLSLGEVDAARASLNGLLEVTRDRDRRAHVRKLLTRLASA